MYDILEFTTLSDQQLLDIEKLEKVVFASTFEASHFREKFPEKSNALALLVYDNEKLIAFKIGYELNPETFYSWMGGVHPDYRRQGLAHQLMVRQHKLAKTNHYLKVRTKTRMSYRHMLIFNLNQGFDIIATETKPQVSEAIIVLEKTL